MIKYLENIFLQPPFSGSGLGGLGGQGTLHIHFSSLFTLVMYLFHFHTDEKESFEGFEGFFGHIG